MGMVKIEHITLKEQFGYISDQLDDLGKVYLQLWLEFMTNQSKILGKLGINQEDWKTLLKEELDL